MQHREWESVLGRILAVIGAGAVPVAASCGGTVDGADHQVPAEPTGTGGRVSAPLPTGGAGGTGFGTSGFGSGGTLFAASGGAPGAADAAVPVFTESDGGVTTYAVPPESSGCPRYATSRRAPAEDDLVLASCSPEAAAKYVAQVVCFPGSDVGQACSEAYDPSCVANEFQGGLITRASFVCGPLASTGGECCYVVAGDQAVGRPFMVAGSPRLASLAHGSGWIAPMAPDVEGLDAETRAALAEVYAKEGLTEHASIAAFARFALECLAVGAPAELVHGAHRAALDEIGHSETAFGLASVYAGHPLGPGPLDARGALDEIGSIEKLAESVAEEGAIAETISALLVAAARDAARDPAVVRALTRIAEEEMAHALLAWRTLAWALDTGGGVVRDRVERAFARAAHRIGFGSVTELRGDATLMRAHGYLGVAERRAIAERALRDVIEPAARQLLHRPPDALTGHLMA